MATHMQKELKTLKALAVAQGWQVQLSGTNHYLWLSPDGSTRIVGNGASPGDNRAVKNLRAALRRGGLRMPRKDGRMA